MLAHKGAAVKLTSPSDLMVYNKLIEYKSKIHSCQEKAYKLQIQTNTWGVLVIEKIYYGNALP